MRVNARKTIYNRQKTNVLGISCPATGRECRATILAHLPTMSAPIFKRYHNTANPYEARFGYHRAVRKGPFVFVSGTTAIDPKSQKLQHRGDAYSQAKAAFAEAVKAVEALGGTRADVCRVRMFVGGQGDCGDVGRAYGDVFGAGAQAEDIGAAATMLVLGLDGFVDKEMKVEIELDAVVL